MNVTVSCGGKFHAFHLAHQLDKRDYLHKLITTYYSPNRGWLPQFRLDSEIITNSKVVTNILPEIISKGFSKVPVIKELADWNYHSLEYFDDWASNKLESCDILVGWSSMSLHTIRRAKSYGAMTIVERGSSHIIFQKEILEEEYKMFGVKDKSVNERIVEKELNEYMEADYISIPSEYVKKTFIEKGVNPNKLIHVPYGVDLANFKPIPKEKEDEVFRVLFVGGLTIRKGIHYLLQAFSELKLNNAELMLIGSSSPEIEPFLKKYEGFYKYLGKISHLDLYKQLSQGSIFVLPSIEEGLAMVIPQAMACGLPVICTTNTGGSDIVRDGQDGFVIPIRNVEALKEKIVYLYENKEARKYMSEMALQRVKRFTWDIYGENIIKSYLEIVT